MKIAFSFLVLMLVFSCTTPKDFIYFQENEEGLSNDELVIPEFKGLNVKTDDILAIQVSSVNSRVSQPYNIIGSREEPEQTIRDFLVDSEGNIDYPGVGTISVVGLTVREVKEALLDKIRPFVTDAVVNARILNFKITVLGEVKLPSVYPQADEQVSILDALGMAGDLTDFGDREKILLIREQNGKQQTFTLNLASKSILGNSNFYLQQNDVIYVSPVEQKTKYARTEPVGRVILPALGVVTALASLVILATNNNR